MLGKVNLHYYGNNPNDHACIYHSLPKKAHGWCTLHWAQTEGWADIAGISIEHYIVRKVVQIMRDIVG